MGQPIPALPSPADAILAAETIHVLASQIPDGDSLELCLSGTSTQETIRVPAYAVAVLIRALEEMAKGKVITLVPVQPELTTQEAADLLNIPALFDSGFGSGNY